MKRRDFVTTALGSVILPHFANGMSAKLSSQSILPAGMTVETNNILVVIQLEGGNDALNMLIPVDQYSQLNAVRGSVLDEENRLLSLTQQDKLKLNPNMMGIKSLYDTGKVKFIQSVGYPNHSSSHASATTSVLSATPTSGFADSGWLGRFWGKYNPAYPNLDNFPNNLPRDPLSIEFGNYNSLLLQDLAASKSVLLENTQTFGRQVYDFSAATMQSCGVNDPLSNTGDLANKRAKYLRSLTQLTNKYIPRLTEVYKNGAPSSDYLNCLIYPSSCPDQELTKQLQIVAALINGGLSTQIYLVRQSGYDTHGNQKYNQGVQLNELSTAIKNFQDKLNPTQKNRVIGMVCTEFGRTIKANGSNGTDHGTAHSTFLFGEKIAGGVLGTNPIIPSASVFNDPALFDAANNIAMQYDYRQIYAALLRQWFCSTPQETADILRGDFAPLPLVNGSTCCTITEPKVTGTNQVLADDTLVYTTDAQANATYLWTVTNGQIVSGQGSNTISVKWGASGTGSVKVQVTQN